MLGRNFSLVSIARCAHPVRSHRSSSSVEATTVPIAFAFCRFIGKPSSCSQPAQCARPCRDKRLSPSTSGEPYFRDSYRVEGETEAFSTDIQQNCAESDLLIAVA